MATVEKLIVAAINGGSYLRACIIEERDRLLVVHAIPGAASWLVLAGGVAYCRN